MNTTITEADAIAVNWPILLGIVFNFVLQVVQLLMTVKNLNCTCFGHKCFSISDKTPR